MLGASMEHGLHNARKPASRGGGGSGPARRHTGQAALGEDHRHDVPVWRPLSSLNGVLAAKSAAHRIHARLHEKAEARKHAHDEGDAGGGARDAPEL